MRCTTAYHHSLEREKPPQPVLFLLPRKEHRSADRQTELPRHHRSTGSVFQNLRRNAAEGSLGQPRDDRRASEEGSEPLVHMLQHSYVGQSPPVAPRFPPWFRRYPIPVGRQSWSHRRLNCNVIVCSSRPVLVPPPGYETADETQLSKMASTLSGEHSPFHALLEGSDRGSGGNSFQSTRFPKPQGSKSMEHSWR